MLLMIGTFQERGKSGETYLKFNEHAFDHQSLSSYQKRAAIDTSKATGCTRICDRAHCPHRDSETPGKPAASERADDGCACVFECVHCTM